MGKDPFGFDSVAVEDSAEIDIDAFAPKPRPVDRAAAKAVREVARNSGFTRRTPRTPPAAAPVADPAADAAAPSKARKRRVNIGELLGLQDRYPDAERAQLNMLAPVPVVLRWRKLVTERQTPAWETLEAAMDALEASSKPRRRETE